MMIRAPTAGVRSCVTRALIVAIKTRRRQSILYASAAGAALGTGEAHLEWLGGAAWQAAYSPTPPLAALALEAEVRLQSLKSALRAREA